MTFQNYLDQIYTINFTKIKIVYINFEDQMRRFFFRPLFDFPDPFFPLQRRIISPTWHLQVRQPPNQNPSHQPNDPHSTFDQFYKENQIKNQSEKEFFKKNYPQKVEEKFDPFKTLEIKQDASLQEVKEAYRNLAIRYHPKNDSTPEAQAKFAQVAKAYETIIESKKNRAYGDLGFGGFFEDFDKEIDNLFSKVEEKKIHKEAKEAPASKKQNGYGQLYSESSRYESVNGQQTNYVIEKIYKKDGKLLSVKRQEKLKQDGKVEITETIDNGKQVKKKAYIQENEVKKISS